MKQSEIDEISASFSEAWRDYFGDKLYYVKFNEDTVAHPVYKENKRKTYDWDMAIEFYGTLRETEEMDVTQPHGKLSKKLYEITVVTKDLEDKGIQQVDTNDIIFYVDRFGNRQVLSIYDNFQKVQFSDNKIFTKIKVKRHG